MQYELSAGDATSTHLYSNTLEIPPYTASSILPLIISDSVRLRLCWRTRSPLIKLLLVSLRRRMAVTCLRQFDTLSHCGERWYLFNLCTGMLNMVFAS